MVIPRFVKQALRNEPITVYGDGTQTRTFTDVKDVVSALIGLIEHPKAAGEVFNVGGTQEITIVHLAEKIIAACNSQSQIHFIPYHEAFGKDFEDMMRRVPGIDKIKALIGYQPETSLDTILKRIIEYIRERDVNAR
jgi:UDP-glucose 4-epimerase